MNRIAAFSTETKKWKQVGELNQARFGHGVFLHQGQVSASFKNCPFLNYSNHKKIAKMGNP